MTVGSQLKQTLAGLRGAGGTLRIYAAQSQHEQARVAYAGALQVVNEVIGELEERLKVLEFAEQQYKGL